MKKRRRVSSLNKLSWKLLTKKGRTCTKKRRQISKLSSASLENLPDDIITEILTRVPANDLTRFKTVCKGWNALLSHQSFLSSQLRRSRSSQQHILLTTSKAEEYKLLYINVHDKENMRVENLPLNLPPKLGKLSAKVSCDGLVLLLDEYDNIYLYNPVTAKYLPLPDRDKHDFDNHFSDRANYIDEWGLIFDDNIGKYKVFSFVLDHHYTHCLVLTLGEYYWRHWSYPGYIEPYSDSSPIFLGKELHWLSQDKGDTSGERWFLVSMDVARMEYRETKLPRMKKRKLLLREVKGSLCIVGIGPYKLDMLVLQDGAWIKQYSTKFQSLMNLPSSMKSFWDRNVHYFAIKDVHDCHISELLKICTYKMGRFMCYDLKGQVSKEIGKISKWKNLDGYSTFYSPTFVRIS